MKRIPQPWQLLSVLLPLAMTGACSKPNGDAAANTDQSGGDQLVRIINVEVSSLTPRPFEEIIRLTGAATARNDVTVSAEEPGEVVKLYAEKGQRVRKGQPLLQVDDRVLRAEIAQVEADSVLASELFERQSAVWKNRIGTEADVLQRRNQLASATARLQLLRARLDKTLLRAPFNGVLDALDVEVGEAVTLWMPTLRVLDAQTLDIEAGVPERYAADVRVGSTAYITFDVLPGREFTGSVHFVGQAVDTSNRTFPVEIELANPDGLIKPEMIANVRLVRQVRDAAIVVPEQTLRHTESGYVAFVAVEGENGTVAEERHVQVGPSYANVTVVESGLRTGDRLITRGQLLVAAGSRVQIVNAEEAQP